LQLLRIYNNMNEIAPLSVTRSADHKNWSKEDSSKSCKNSRLWKYTTLFWGNNHSSYFPLPDEINKTIVDLQNNPRNCYHEYIYSDLNNNNKPLFKIVSKEKCDASC
jgi:hypothetical protein